MTGNIKNIAASVHQRLLSKARDSNRPFSALLQHFAIERFIYRISRSPLASRFVLKGALLFSVWGGPGSRPTMDIDLLGKIDNRLEVIIAAIKEACEIDVGKDADKQVQWRGFIRKAKLADAPVVFEDIVAAVKVFLEPLVDSLAGQRMFHGTWNAPGPWL